MSENLSHDACIKELLPELYVDDKTSTVVTRTCVMERFKNDDKAVKEKILERNLNQNEAFIFYYGARQDAKHDVRQALLQLSLAEAKEQIDKLRKTVEKLQQQIPVQKTTSQKKITKRKKIVNEGK